MRHYHYEVCAFNYKFPYPKGALSEELQKTEYQMGGITIMNVSALSEEEAIDKVKKVLKRKYYRLMKVHECEIGHKEYEKVVIN